MIQLKNDVIKVKENDEWSSVASLTGPQGEKGDKGDQGIQGIQGIQGEPGYPEIQTGDAGKVLTVNDTEDAVEWKETIQGLDIIRTFTTDSSFSSNVFTAEELARCIIGKAACVFDTTGSRRGLWLLIEKDSSNNYKFTQLSTESSTSFNMNSSYFTVNSTTGACQGIYGSSIKVVNDGTINRDYGFDRNATDNRGAYVAYAAFGEPNTSYGARYGWKTIPKAGTGLVAQNDGTFDMSVPVVREEDTIDVKTDFVAADCVKNGSNYRWTDATKVNQIMTLWTALGKPEKVIFGGTYNKQGNTPTTFEEEVTISTYRNGFRFYCGGYTSVGGGIYQFTVDPDNNLFEIYDGWGYIQNVSNITDFYITLPEGQGTYTYTTKLPIEAIECDKTTAGTYTLKCTVDAQGNKTYAWV